MGNTLLDKPSKRKDDPVQQFDLWLDQNTDLLNKKMHYQNKLFKSVSFVYKSKAPSLLFKAYFNYEKMNLEEYYNNFQAIKKAVDPNYYHNMLPYIQFKNFQTQVSGFVVAIRQYMSTTLEERLMNQPLLSQDQKIWIIFQMILCVYGLHVEANLYHGNIRTSNFLLQNNNHLVLTDLASYKPLYLLENDLAEVRIFYGSSIDKCTLAPQKIIKQSGKEQINRSPTELLKGYKKSRPLGFNKLASMGQIKQNITNSSEYDESSIMPMSQHLSMENKMSSNSDSGFQYTNSVKNQKSMDIFSLGISILEVLLNGKTLMKFQNLLQFRKDQYSLQNYIDSAVEGLQGAGEKIKIMLSMMLEKDPEKRPSIQIILSIWHQTMKKDVHVLTWYLQSLFSKSSFILPDLRIGLIRKIVQRIQEQQPLKDRYKMKMDLSTDIQKIDLLRMMMSLIDKNIMPNLQRTGLAEKSIIKQIQKSLEYEPLIQKESQIQLSRDSPSRSRGMSIFQMKSKQSMIKEQGSQFTSIQNLKKKDFHDRSERVIEEQILELCPPKWCTSLQGLVKSKFSGTKLSEFQQSHNKFQDLLNDIKNNQHLRERYNTLTHFEQYEEIIRLLFSNIRTISSVSNRLAAVELLYVIGRASTSRVKLSKIIPFLLNLMGDSEERVATYSLRCLIKLFYTFKDVFNSVEDTRYYRTIVQGFNTASKSSSLRLVLFEKLPAILKILEWLALNQSKYVKNFLIQSDQNALIESILKQYGSLNSNQKQVLLLNASKIWIPSFIPFFGSMMNIQKVLCFKQSLEIALELEKSKINQLDFLDMCLESGLDEYGLAVFYSIRYFRIRKIIKQEFIIKIIPLILYPNRWIHEEVVSYIKICLENYPSTKLYFIFNKCLELPFPIQPSEYLSLPDMLPSKVVKEKKFNANNKTAALFGKYWNKFKVAKQYPQNTEQTIKKWNEASKDLVMNQLIVQERRASNSLGNQIVEYISSLNIKNLLFFISLLKKSYGQQIQVSNIQFNSTNELIELCDRSYNFNIHNTSSVSYYQKHLLMHIQSYLTLNSQSFLRAGGLNSCYYKKLFSENLIKTNSIINLIDNFQIFPTLELGKYSREPTQMSKLNRPMGILIGEIHEHKDIISCIQKVADRFFLTGSYDGTLRLFDSKRLEDDVTSDSIGIINFHHQLNDTSGSVKVTSACVFQDTYSVAVATTKGTVGLYRIQSMSKGSPTKTNKSKKYNSSLELIKTFNAVGQIEKVITLKNQLKHSTFGVVTSEGWLALQDIRIKRQAYKCSLGKERGMPKSFIALPGTNTLAIGTMNGYILLYDIRCNLVSNIYELNYDSQNPPILYMQTVPQLFHTEENQQLLAVSYPSKNYEFCYFNMNSTNKPHIDPQQMFTSSNSEDCIAAPYLLNKTKNESFKICNNNLRQKSYYNSFIPDFYSKLDILDYLKDPLTINQSQVKQKWLSQSKQKYAQITSISNKRSLPFIEYLQGKILTNMNPIIASKGQTNSRNRNKAGDNLALLNTNVNKKEGNIINPIQKTLKKVGPYTYMPQDQAIDYYTCCKTMPNFVVAGSRDSLVKIYK